ncbi:MAG: hypothetical protein LBL00_06370 [Endomicrobium sp.]|jgi:predicted DNA-binding protein|nr:hypothetical protein [Endomicrobium sp.]
MPPAKTKKEGYIMQVSLRLKEPILSRLNSLSKKSGHSKTFLIIQAITEHLSDLETIYLTQERLEAIKSGEVKTISWKEVQKKNGIL